jgi:hypothetical protein
MAKTRRSWDIFSPKGEELVKHRKGMVVLCHLKPSAFHESNRSGIVVDAFSIGPGERFVRTLRLPRDTIPWNC